MKLAKPILAALTVGLVLALVFAFFAVELASGQSRARDQIKTEVQDRAVLAASLINTIFGTLENPGRQDTSLYGGPVVPQKNLDAAVNGERYVVVTDASGRVMAASTGFDRSTPLAVPPATLARLVADHAPYYLGDLAGRGGSLVTDLVVPFAAKDGQVRLLVTGLNPNAAAFAAFFGTELRSVPGVKGELNYIVDGRGRVVSASDAAVRPGTALTRPGPQLLGRRSGETGGRFFQTAALNGSAWRVLLVAPDGALFSSVNGAREYVPWIIFAALVASAAAAALLGWRVLRSADQLSAANSRLAAVNAELSVANESLHRRAAELARSNEELDSFASIASHDLQEPLRKVRTFTEQLTVLEADHLSEKGREYVVRANAAAERMQRLIEDLLKFSRVSTQGRPFEQVDLAQVARRVVDDLEQQIGDTHAEVDIGPLPSLTGDPLQMQQLIQNLVSNAIKFHRPDAVPTVRVRGDVVGDVVRLSVTDDGIGFEPRYAARIFRIFERLHGRNDYPGTGIGLALCRKIADRHGGSIEAESEPGHGATFTVTLPVDQPAGGHGYGAHEGRSEEVPTGAHV